MYKETRFTVPAKIRAVRAAIPTPQNSPEQFHTSRKIAGQDVVETWSNAFNRDQVKEGARILSFFCAGLCGSDGGFPTY